MIYEDLRQEEAGGKVYGFIEVIYRQEKASGKRARVVEDKE